MKNFHNKILLGDKEICFNYNVDTVLYFQKYAVVLLMDGTAPTDNNIEAWDYNGNKLWNISEIIEMGLPEAYVYIRKGFKTQLVTQSYTGVHFVIDLESREIIEEECTK